MNYLRAEIKKQLALRGWKSADLAKAANLSLSQVYEFMKGRSMTVSTERAIRKALDIKEV